MTNSMKRKRELKGLIIIFISCVVSYLLFKIFGGDGSGFIESDYFKLIGMPPIVVGCIFLTVLSDYKEKVRIDLFGKLLLSILLFIYISIVYFVVF